MKICITAQGNNLDSPVDPRFGRCAFFIIIDPENMEFEAIDNTNAGATGGAGIKAGQLVSSKEVKVVLTGNCGPNAFQTLSAAGIEVISGVSGIVRNAVAQYNSGELKAVTGPSVDSHFGIKGKG